MDHRGPSQVEREVQSATVIKKDRRKTPIFVHSALDDYGLTPIEFRAYGRIARRAGDLGACWESVPNMARDLGVSGRTLRRSLRVLANACLVIETERDGETTERRITLPGQWKDKTDLPGIRKRVTNKDKKPTPDTRARGVIRATPDARARTRLTPRQGEGLTPRQGPPLTPEQHEGTPSEGSPIEGNPMKEIPHTQGCVSKFSREDRIQHAQSNGLGPGWLNNSDDGRHDWLIEIQSHSSKGKEPRMTIRERLEREKVS
jgi:hypothetical protein